MVLHLAVRRSVIIYISLCNLALNPDSGRTISLVRQSYHTRDGLILTNPQLLSGSKDLCQKVEDMLGGLLLRLHRQHVTSLMSAMTSPLSLHAAAASSTTFSRDVRLRAGQSTLPRRFMALLFQRAMIVLCQLIGWKRARLLCSWPMTTVEVMYHTMHCYYIAYTIFGFGEKGGSRYYGEGSFTRDHAICVISYWWCFET